MHPALPTWPPHLSNTTSTSHGDASGLQSSASSVVNVDMGEGMLVRDVDAEVEVEVGEGEAGPGSAVGHIEAGFSNEEARRNLRDQLKRSLSQMAVNDDASTAIDNLPPREYYVLTDAGKPVFTSGTKRGHDELASAIGLMQAIISVFIDDGDKLRCINAGDTRITFLLRSPLYYVCVSAWREPESVTRSHLEYLHLQILSVVSAAQLRRIFEKRTNFDLRRLLTGAETFLHSLLARLETDLAMSTSSLLCLKLDAALRTRAAEALVPGSKMKDILYVVLVARERVVTLVRPKKHSVHPSDLHILLNTIHAPSIFDSPASWLPICLPKFNPAGFLHAYVSFPQEEEEEGGGREGEGEPTTPKPRIVDPRPDLSVEAEDVATPTADRSEATRDKNDAPAELARIEREKGRGERVGLGFVCVSGGGEFESIREWSEGVLKKLETDHVLAGIRSAVRSGSTEYTAADVGVPGLRHFVYKSRALVQVTMPVLEEPYRSVEGRRRLVTLYQRLHDAIHAKSGQEGPLKLQYIQTERESVMGWITQPFELYICLPPRLPKSAVVGAANAVTRWVKQEESRLFLRDAPVF
ncbi:DUF254-domain-containing protein [Rickenella mellea]|uniref:Vacuolar fusion protein MON1 n=1 Tax=Rickenella mellea TaxID=50990 RepID=A0A4Y7PRQ8_9AGAM|nr:DUF254-domain-containing protein [Rickenella mellea]